MKKATKFLLPLVLVTASFTTPALADNIEYLGQIGEGYVLFTDLDEVTIANISPQEINVGGTMYLYDTEKQVYAVTVIATSKQACIRRGGELLASVIEPLPGSRKEKRMVKWNGLKSSGFDRAATAICAKAFGTPSETAPPKTKSGKGGTWI